MKKTSMVYLLAGLLAGVPLWTAAKGVAAEQGKEQWQFENFGKNAAGDVQVEGKRMTLTTQNTRQAFFESDQYSFAFQKQPFPYDDCSRSSVTVTVEKIDAGSAGIMMRSGERVDAANAHLEVNATGSLILFFRSTDGTSTAYRRLGDVTLPVEIRLVRQGNMFLAYYKGSNGQWIKGATAIAEVGEEQLTGFYACSGNESQIGYDIETLRKTQAVFRDWTVSYEENYIPAEKAFVDKTPVKDGTLLRENFADGNMSNTPASITNPVWKGIKYAELPRDKDGNRYWRKRGDGVFFLGDKQWADYEVTIDLSFAKDSPPASTFTLQARFQNISIYDKMRKYYGITFRGGDKVFLERVEEGGNRVIALGNAKISPYADGLKHQLKVKLLDRHYEIWLDGKLLLQGTDESRSVITYGNMALQFSDVDMSIYGIEVLNVDDPINGSLDNYLLDYYDTPAPAYLKKYGYEVK